MFIFTNSLSLPLSLYVTLKMSTEAAVALICHFNDDILSSSSSLPLISFLGVTASILHDYVKSLRQVQIL